MINAIIKVEKLRADDIFYNQTGIEEEDVEPSLLRLKLDKDPEFLNITELYSKKSTEYLEAKKKETEEMMRKAQEMQAKNIAE